MLLCYTAHDRLSYHYYIHCHAGVRAFLKLLACDTSGAELPELSPASWERSAGFFVRVPLQPTDLSSE